MKIGDIGGEKVLLCQPFPYLQWKKWPEKEILSLPMVQNHHTKFPKSPEILSQVTEDLLGIQGIKKILVTMEVVISEGLHMAIQGLHCQEEIPGIQVEGSTKNVEAI